MDILLQLGIIITFTFVGDFLSSSFKLPIPGSIIGLLLMFFALQFKLLKLKQVEVVGNWLKNHLAFFFVPVTVSIMTYLDILKASWLDIVIVLIVSTLITYLATAYAVKFQRRKETSR